jgi:hypothetical protein
MIIRTVICRLFLSALLAIFLISSLLDTFDQENLFPAFATRISSSAVDNDSPLEKKKKSSAIGQIFFVYKIDKVQEKLFIFKESFLSLPFIFSYFLRAPPLV